MFWENSIETVYCQGWNRSPAQVGCMRQVLRAGALGRPRGMGWGGRWKGGSGWGTRVNPWLIHVNVWQKPLQYIKKIIIKVVLKFTFYRLSRCTYVCALSYVWLFVVPWTVAHQTPLSMGFLSKNTGVGCHFPLQRTFQIQELRLHLLCLLHWQADSLPLSHLGSQWA